MTESDFSEYIRADLEKIGFTTYAEVMDKNSRRRADLVARIENDPLEEKYGEVTIFEAKLSFNLKVLQQAYYWKIYKKAHRTYILVPSSNKNLNDRKFGRELCKLLGIGVMEVDINKNKYYVTVKPEYNQSPNLITLYPEQRMIIASNADNVYMTPFKVTVLNINAFFKEKQFAYITDLIKNIKHHYKSDVAAAKAIKMLIDKKVIKGFYLAKKNHKIVIGKMLVNKQEELEKVKESGLQDIHNDNIPE